MTTEVSPAEAKLQAILSAGRFHDLRTEAKALLATELPDDERARILALVAKTNAEPMATRMVVLTLLLVLALSSYWTLRKPSAPPGEVHKIETVH